MLQINQIVRIYVLYQMVTNFCNTKFRPGSLKKGNIKNEDGKVIGVHDGIINFTIGQRKGSKYLILNLFMFLR